MIDLEGFRANVGIVLANNEGRVLWARRVGGQDSWQFPQGGINVDESPEQALYRELQEEIGLTKNDVEMLAETTGWLRYRLPKQFVRSKPNKDGRICIGQKQKWFLLKLTADEQTIHFDNSDDEPAEFDHWQWVSYWHPVNQVVSFKREVYRKALKQLSPYQLLLEEND